MRHEQATGRRLYRLATLVLSALMVMVLAALPVAAAPSQLGEGVGVGARALAMGGAFIAVADDASAGFWNPAGLEQLEKRWASYTGLINNRDQSPAFDDFLVYAEPDNGFASGSLALLHEKHQVDPATDPNLVAGKTVYSYSLALKAASTGLSFGASLKYITQTAVTAGGSSVGGSAFSVDGGGLLRLGPSLSLGVVVQDITGPEIRYSSDPSVPPEHLPLRVHAGIAWRPDDKTVFAVDGHNLYVAEAQGGGTGGSEGRTVHVGVERWLTSNIAVRAGAQAGIGFSTQAITAGAALRYSDWQLDYAFLARDLGNTSVVSLNYRF